MDKVEESDASGADQYNRSGRYIEYHTTVAGILQQQAVLRPHLDAIISPGAPAVTFKVLFEHIEQLAAELNGLGIGRNDRVAVVLPNGAQMAMTVLGVSACASCAPLNPAYHQNDFEFYLTDLDARALILSAEDNPSARRVADQLGIPVIDLGPWDESAVARLGCSTEVRGVPLNTGFALPEDIALVLHTSGTTSRPKIVPLTHRNICSSAHNVANFLRLGPEDRCLNVMPLFHIHGLIAGLLSSLTAASSVVCTPGFRADSFYAWIQTFRPSWYTAVPTMHQSVLTRAAENRAVIVSNRLRFIRSSSSSLPPTVMEQLEAVFGVPVVEAYGMTEAAHQMACNPLPPGNRKAGSVGIAAGPEVAVMDEAGELLEQGETGEIVIRGPNVMQGYENNSDANAAAFTNGWFRTGDQGRLDADGYLFITGRLKEIINRGGEKVSPREIDEVLLRHPDIAQAVAFAIPHSTLGEDIAVAAVLKPGASLTESAIREFAFENLTDFKVPAQVLIVDEIPKGSTGKLQRIGLASKFSEQLKREFVAPRTEVELIIADIYADVLRLDRVSVEDNFFAIGGDSLRATQAISRIRTMLNVDIPIVTVFRKPTVTELAQEIERFMPEADAALLTELLNEIGNLSDEEARQLLDEELKRS